MTTQRMRSAAVFGLLLAVIIVGRLACQTPNVAPVAAAALFAGYYFRSPLAAFAVPLLGTGLSDLWLGAYDPATMAVVYACYAIPVVLGRLALRRVTPLRLGGTTLGASGSFFVLTNLAVWAFSGMYPLSAAGLGACYVAALPFFKYTLIGDALFTGVIFGTHAAVTALAGRGASVRLAPVPDAHSAGA